MFNEVYRLYTDEHRPYPPYRQFQEAPPLELPTTMMGNLEYTGWEDEQMSWKTHCYVGDWTFVPKVRVKGPDALKLFSDLSVNTFTNFPIERAKHCVQCNEDGKVIAEGILMRWGEDELEFICGTPLWTFFNALKGGYDVKAWLPMSTVLQLGGPKALALAEKLTSQNLKDVKFMWTTDGVINQGDVRLLRQGMSGEIGGFEIHAPFEKHDALIDHIMQEGKEFGIRRLGRRTFMINHLEACFPTSALHFINALPVAKRQEFLDFVDSGLPDDVKNIPYVIGPRRFNLTATFTGSFDGSDTDELNRSPIELGWKKVINFDHDFIGKEALKKELEHPKRTVVTLEFDSEDMVRIYAAFFKDGDTYPLLEMPHGQEHTAWNDKVLKDGKVIGYATFPGYSYYFRKALALSFIDVEHAEIGSQVTVLWGNPGKPQTEIKATVRPAPYKKDNRRDDLRNAAP